jgi:FkbM family methyltransferase
MANQVHEVHQFLRSGMFDAQGEHTFLEVGAHIAIDTFELRRAFPRARIYAFEPDPRNIYTIKNVGVEKFFTLVEAAVSDVDGETTLYLSGGAPPGSPRQVVQTGWTQSSSIKKPDQVTKVYPWMNFSRTAKVRTIRLDTFKRERAIDVVDFIWADVQGAERELILGGQETLARTRFLFTEFGFERLYEGEIGKDELIALLPGSWTVMRTWTWDVLLKNNAFP